MAEPVSISATSIAAAASVITLAAFGVDYYSLLYGMIGALLAADRGDKMGRTRAIVWVSLSSIVGAVIGNIITEYFGLKSKFMLIGLCLLGGIMAQAAASAIVQGTPVLIDTLVRAIGAAIPGWLRGGGGKQ